MLDLIVSFIGFLHVLFAVYLIGSGFFLEFIAKPNIVGNLSPPDAGKTIMAISKKFMTVVLISWIVIPLTGLYRLFFVMEFQLDGLFNSLYGNILLIKMLVVALAFVITLLIINTSKKMVAVEPAQRPPFAKVIGQYARIQAVLGLIIILLAVVLRNAYTG